MTNVIPAPECYVVPDSDERLDSVVLENETVVSDGMVSQEGATAANITSHLVTILFGLMVLFGAQLVHPRITQRNEHFKFPGGVKLRYVLKGHEWEIQECITLPIFFIHCEGRDLMVAITREVIMRQPGNVTRAENNQP